MKSRLVLLFNSKRLIPVLCATLVLLFCMISSCITVSSYISSSDPSGNAGVASFTPSLALDDAWDYEGSFTAAESSSGLPFTVDNSGGMVSARLTVVLKIDGFLPFAYSLTAGGSEISPASISDGVYTYFIDIGAQKMDFRVMADWIPESYDERLNGFTVNFTVSVFCEQTQGEGI